MSNPKLHHTAAKTYLKFFSDDKKNIFRYDKQTKETKLIGIKNTGAITDFYTVVDSSGNKNTCVENPFLSGIDDVYRSLVEKLMTMTPLEELKNDLIIVMSSQYARVDKQRDRWKGVITDINEQRKNLGIQNNAMTKENNNNLILSMLTEMEVYSGCASNSYFAVFISDSHEFVTCDNPADKAFFPLTHMMALAMPSEKPSRDYMLADNDMVDRINRMTFDKAKRYIYGRTKKATETLRFQYS